jgi:hypothetical protein
MKCSETISQILGKYVNVYTTVTIYGAANRLAHRAQLR